jgi:hypothetical protein
MQELTSHNEISLTVYKPELRKTWDDFVSNSKNGVFFFERNYMEYHADRFADHSLLFFKNGDPVAIMPANVREDTLYSHQGLTFGGVISSRDMRAETMLDVFALIIQHAKEIGVKRIVYKAIPRIYHDIPSDEDLYALYYYGAKLLRRDITTTVSLDRKFQFDKNRLRTIKKAHHNNIVVRESVDYATFMMILEQVLRERHAVQPVHSIPEIELLASRFPNNIKLFASYKENKMLAGVVMYESKHVAHSQYIANSNEGWPIGALDVLFDYLIRSYVGKKRFFDFGISTEKEGHFLNKGLISYKEGFAGSGAVHDFYELNLRPSSSC